MMRLRITALLSLFLATTAASAGPPASAYVVTWAMESRVNPGDGAGHDFLAVFDIGDGATFGKLVAMLPVPTRAAMAHHTDYVLAHNRMLFAEDFMAAHSYVFDLQRPQHPTIAASFSNAGPYTHLHSFARLSNGNTLATYQVKGPQDKVPGALVELDPLGHVVRTSDAGAPQIDPYVRPYSLEVIEPLNRVVTTSADMFMGPTAKSSHVVQVWRLSDLKLLKTIALPKQKIFKNAAGMDADEPRVLADGKTVLVKTSGCGLYKIDGLQGTNPTAEFIYDFGYRACAGVPVVVGKYWVQPSLSGHTITSLDVSNPSKPVQAGLLLLGPQARPHWIAREPGRNRLVITGFGSMLNHIYFATIDPPTGALTLESRSIDMVRKWPDGWNGPAIPHGTLFCCN